MAEKTKTKKADKKPPVSSCFVNRELSWLEFNRRVLMEAADMKTPLLERLKFLSIYQSNLEEFFMVRVGILTHRSILLPDSKDRCSGWTPEEQIENIRRTVAEQQVIAENIWKAIKDDLKAAGVDVLDFKKISKVDELMSKKIFNGIKPMLIPRIIENGGVFPMLWGREQYIFANLSRGNENKYCVIPLDRVPAYTAFEIDGRQKIALTAPLIQHFLPLLLKKENVRESVVIQVLRNADVFISDNSGSEDENFRVKMSDMLKKRRQQQPVRLQIIGKLSANAKSYLIKKLNVSERSVFASTIPFDLSFRSSVKRAAGFVYDERRPAKDIGLKKGEYFKYIEKHDLLLSFPFQSMNPFVEMLYEAADDPEVESIRITLYRLAANSKVAAALAYAADRGKHVLCLLELRARFDEQNNIDYSELLEDAGCHIIYGLPNQKVHSKICLITKRGESGVSHITQIGTGNYNEVTSEQYCDLSLITANEAVAADVENAFNALLIGQLPPPAAAMWIAPLSFKDKLLEMLDREIAKGENGRVVIKVNSINHMEIMQKLIECSQAGVKVDLHVRGICCLVPGIPGYTENIRVKSVIGRWLEHARIYKFGTGADARMFIGSGDLLNRNVERRVEAFIEVVTPETRKQVDHILACLEADLSKGWIMNSDGSFSKHPSPADTSSHEALYKYFSKAKVSLESPKIPAAVPEQKKNRGIIRLIRKLSRK